MYFEKFSLSTRLTNNDWGALFSSLLFIISISIYKVEKVFVVFVILFRWCYESCIESSALCLSFSRSVLSRLIFHGIGKEEEEEAKGKKVFLTWFYSLNYLFCLQYFYALKLRVCFCQVRISCVYFFFLLFSNKEKMIGSICLGK